MKRNEIIREYKWVKVLHAILRMVDKLPGVIMSLIIGPLSIVVGVLSVLLMVSPVLICLLIIWFISTFNIVGVIVGLLVFALVWVFYITMTEDKIIEWPKLLWRRSCSLRHYSPNLSVRLLRHYEKKWGMNEEQIKDYLAKREVFEKGSISYILPLLHRLSELNMGDRDEQTIFLSERFNEDEIHQIFEKGDFKFEYEEAISYWRKDLSEKKLLMDLLFKFSIVEDGIHNDEWKLLMQIMTQLRFNNRYIEYFKDRFSSLRTEFDDYERKSTSSLGGYSFASLESYYAVLGVEKDASIEEIKRAYHELAMQHHPDLPKNANRKEECEAKMMEINEAYEKVRG